MPTLRRNVDLPPWFAPVIITSDLFSASTSLPTTVSSHAQRQANVVQPPAPERRSDPVASGDGKQIGSPFSAEPFVQIHAADVEAELGPQHV